MEQIEGSNFGLATVPVMCFYILKVVENKFKHQIIGIIYIVLRTSLNLPKNLELLRSLTSFALVLCLFSHRIFYFESKHQNLLSIRISELQQEKKMWQMVFQKTNVGICLYDMEARKITHHNGTLGEMLGVVTEKNHQMIESALLKKKKHNLKESNDKRLMTVQKAISDVLNRMHSEATSVLGSTEKDLFRYQVEKTNKNIVISAQHIIEDNQ